MNEISLGTGSFFFKGCELPVKDCTIIKEMDWKVAKAIYDALLGKNSYRNNEYYKKLCHTHTEEEIQQSLVNVAILFGIK